MLISLHITSPSLLSGNKILNIPLRTPKPTTIYITVDNEVHIPFPSLPPPPYRQPRGTSPRREFPTSRLPIFIMLTSDHRLTSKNESLSHQFGASGKRMRTEREDIWIALTRRMDRALEIRPGQMVRDLGVLMVDMIQLRRILEIWVSL